MLSIRSLLIPALATLIVCGNTIWASPAGAVDTVTAGTVGFGSTTTWPIYIGIKKGFFDAVDIHVDPVSGPSSAAIVQQAAAGSINLTMGSGIVDPIRAIEKGAPLAIWRIDIQSPPYALLAKASINNIGDLKGKIVSIGGPKDITRIFVERMLVPNGVKPNEVDYIFAGATSARLSALQSGAVDAAILTSPQNFYAEAAGFRNIGWAAEYAKELPFSGGSVNRVWAAANKSTLDRFMTVYNKSVNWFQDSNNRSEAVAILMEVSHQKQEDVEKSYDFLQKGNYYELSGKIPRGSLGNLIKVLQELGDLPAEFNVDRLLMPGVAEVKP